MDRRRLVIGYWLTLVGILLAIVVAGLIPVPAPPPCGTEVCNTAYATAYGGLALMIAGMAAIASGLFRSEPPPSSVAGAAAGPDYSFVPPPPAPPPGAPPLSPTVRRCPACGASVTEEFGFCPRCGRTLTP